MTFEITKFKIIWKVIFKHLFVVMVVVASIRAGVQIMQGEGDSITLNSIFIALALAFVGTAFLSGLITIIAINSVDKNK